MTDGNTEPKFSHTPETLPPAAPERPTGAVPPREAKEKPPEAAPETTQPAETVEPKTKDFFQVLRRKKPKVVAIPQVRDAVTVRVERILEDGLGESYARLSPVAKQEFKLKGEETARKIRELIRSGHGQVKKIFRLILEWLKMLPGINRFFLEQEAKIKTDRIIALSKKQAPEE